LEAEVGRREEVGLGCWGNYYRDWRWNLSWRGDCGKRCLAAVVPRDSVNRLLLLLLLQQRQHHRLGGTERERLDFVLALVLV